MLLSLGTAGGYVGDGSEVAVHEACSSARRTLALGLGLGAALAEACGVSTHRHGCELR